jgi:hypothetical protein
VGWGEENSFTELQILRLRPLALLIAVALKRTRQDGHKQRRKVMGGELFLIILLLRLLFVVSITEYLR